MTDNRREKKEARLLQTALDCNYTKALRLMREYYQIHDMTPGSENIHAIARWAEGRK